jgi:hypothetical protein
VVLCLADQAKPEPAVIALSIYAVLSDNRLPAFRVGAPISVEFTFMELVNLEFFKFIEGFLGN